MIGTEQGVNWEVVPPHQPILAAVSGGADSMALLWLLWQAGRRVVVGHVDHGLRGDSAEDSAFVARHAAGLGLPFAGVCLHLSPGGHEATWREARYLALAELARRHQCPLIATGHTAADQLETILLNWLRGQAVAGMAGMRSRRALQELLVVRPLLHCTRDATREWCRQAGWQWREDPTNDNADRLRNRVRQTLLPALESVLEPGRTLAGLTQATAVSAELIQQELDLAAAAAAAALDRILLSQAVNLVVLQGEAFRELTPILQRLVLREAVRRLEGEVRDLALARCEEVRRHVVAASRHAVWQWRGGLRVEWTAEGGGNRLRLQRVKPPDTPDGTARRVEGDELS